MKILKVTKNWAAVVLPSEGKIVHLSISTWITFDITKYYSISSRSELINQKHLLMTFFRTQSRHHFIECIWRFFQEFIWIYLLLRTMWEMHLEIAVSIICMYKIPVTCLMLLFWNVSSKGSMSVTTVIQEHYSGFFMLEHNHCK